MANPTTHAIGLLVSQMESDCKAHASRRSAEPPGTPAVRVRKVPVAPDLAVATRALSFLDVFGYLDRVAAGWQNVNLQDIIAAVKQFQGFVGLSPSGVVNGETVAALSAPRCGFPDVVRDRHVEALRVRKWAAERLTRWAKTGITYGVDQYLPGLAKADLDAVLAKAFGAWTSLVNFGATQITSGTPDIAIGYGSGAADQFDGPGGVLAWCYLPQGDDSQLRMKFDVAEGWSLSPQQQGILILNVATHELGHGLGLTHSAMNTALMAPYYNPGIATPQQQDDVPRIVDLYGVKPPVGPPVPPAPGPVPPSSASVAVTITGLPSVVVNGKTIPLA